jgi:hypothetical protein
MTARYLAGALLAVLAGAVLNLGVLIQKKAVNATPAGPGPLMGRLLRNRVWMGGFALQFLLGSPMYAGAQLLIGPALIPGLMATGLIVLALGSPLVAGEPVRGSDWAGVALIIVAVALLGLSRLSVDLRVIDVFGGPLLVRLAVSTAALAVLAFGLQTASRGVPGARGPLLILGSGILFALGNLWLGVLMAGFARLFLGEVTTRNLAGVAAAAALVAATNLLSVVWTQNAFREGRATMLVPLQQVPMQVIPAASYFVVFLQAPADASSVLLAGLAVTLILGGAVVLGAHPVAARAG